MKLYARKIPAHCDPCAAFQTLFAHANAAFWLDSNCRGRDATASYMGDASGPHARVLTCRAAPQTLQIQSRHGSETRGEHVLSYLERALPKRPLEHVAYPLDFCGGYVGYLGYELGMQLLGHPIETAATPDAAWIFADRLVAFDHARNEIWLLCVDDPDRLCEENRDWMATVEQQLQHGNSPASEPTPSEVRFTWRHTAAAYRQHILTALQHIRRGESYELCLTNQLQGNLAIEPFDVYKVLRHLNPAPYSSYFQLRDLQLAVLCTSPELFLAMTPDGQMRSKPIKGTAPRGASADDDRRIARDLAHDVKARSENLMIVDLVRNDMNRVAEIGSVSVPSLFDVETYPTVHQLVSTITARRRADCTPIDCIESLFPGGSMTGAPKIRTTHLLAELEAGPRGIYSGTLGYLSLNHAVQLNMIIRTLICHHDRISLGTGGAIVALSDPDQEIAETKLKVQALLRALQAAGVTVHIDESP